jgi:hypothetical protein
MHKYGRRPADAVEHGLRAVVRSPVDHSFFSWFEALLGLGADLPADFAHGGDEQHVLVASWKDVGTFPHVSGVNRIYGLDVATRAFDKRMQVGPAAQVSRGIREGPCRLSRGLRSREAASSSWLRARLTDRGSR